jgi:hypothetical protein
VGQLPVPDQNSRGENGVQELANSIPSTLGGLVGRKPGHGKKAMNPIAHLCPVGYNCPSPPLKNLKPGHASF